MSVRPSRLSTLAGSGKIGVGNCRIFLRLLREQGMDPMPVLRKTGLTEGQLARFDQSIPHEVFLRLIFDCLLLTGDPLLGLKAGRCAHFWDLDLWEPLVCLAPRFSEQVLQRDMSLAQHADTQVIFERDRAICRLRRPRDVPASRIWGEYFAVRTMTLATLILDRSDLVEVRLMHRTPPYPPDYARMFGCPVRFGAEQVEVIFSWPSVHSDAPE